MGETKNMTKHAVCILILVLLSVTLLSAEEPYRGISLQQARDLALQQNPEYQSAGAALNAARWSKTNAISSMLPSLSFSGTMLYMDPATTVNTGGNPIELNNDQRTMSLNLSQPLFVGGKLYQAYKIAENSHELSKLSLSAQALSLISEVESKYYAVLQLQDAYEIALSEQQQALNNLELAELKQQNGLIARADYLRFQANKNNKDLALLQGETALKLALKDFNNYLAATEPLMPMKLNLNAGGVEMFTELDAKAIDVFTQRALNLANQSNISLRSVNKSLELSERAYKIAKGSFLPTLMLTGSRQYKENGLDRYDFEASNQIMLNLSIPLLPQVGNYAAARKAYFDAEKQRYEAESAIAGIKLGIEAAAINLISSARQVESAQLSLQITQDMYDQLLERFRLNMLSGMELLDAELMLSASRLANNNAFYNFFKARLALLTAMGTDDYSVLNTLLQR